MFFLRLLLIAASLGVQLVSAFSASRSANRLQQLQSGFRSRNSLACPLLMPAQRRVTNSAFTLQATRESTALPPGELNVIQKWGPVLGQWAIWSGILAGTSFLILAAGDAHVLGFSTEAAQRASIIFPVVVAASTFFNLLLISFQGGGDRVARIMGGSPTSDPAITNLVQSVLDDARLPTAVSQVYVIPSPEPNAFAAGTGNNVVIAVTTDVGRALQVAAMVAGLATAMQAGDFFLRSSARWPRSVRRNRYDESEQDDLSLTALIGFCLLLAGALTFTTASLLRLSSSRSAEFAADAFAAKTIPNGAADLSSALLKLESRHDSIPRDVLDAARGTFNHMLIDNPPVRQGPLQSLWGLLQTHPPIEERIKRLQKMI